MDTLEIKSRGRNSATSMETQHVRAGWMQKTWCILYLIPPSSCFDYFIDTLYHKCMYHVPTKNPSKTKISKFHRERKILMRKRTKLRKMSSTKSITQLIKIEQAICDSHFKEKLNEESIAVAKIKSDPNFFFRYAKKFSICK